MNDRVIDMIFSSPGEKYKLRFLGNPVFRNRFYFIIDDEIEYFDFKGSKEDFARIKGEGVKSSLEWWVLALDILDDERLVVVEIPDSLLKFIASCSKASSTRLGGDDGEVVKIEVSSGDPRFLVSLGEKKLLNQEAIDGYGKSRDQLAEIILSPATADEIIEISKNNKQYSPTNYISKNSKVVNDFTRLPGIKKIDFSDFAFVLKDLCLYISENSDNDRVAVSAANILRVLRSKENE